MSWIRYLIPGLLWFSLLDIVRDGCCYPLVGSDFVCELLVAIGWILLLNEIRHQIKSRFLLYIHKKYYQPYKAKLERYWSYWETRLVVGCVCFSVSYVWTWYITKSIQREQQEQEGDTGTENVLLMARSFVPNLKEERISHRIVQAILAQANVMIWLFGTFLQMDQHWFLPLVVVVNVLSPLCGFITGWCGNFALWLLLGVTVQRLFDLVPEHRPSNFGVRGTVIAAIVSSICCHPYGLEEMKITLFVAIVGEFIYRHYIMKVPNASLTNTSIATSSRTNRNDEAGKIRSRKPVIDTTSSSTAAAAAASPTAASSVQVDNGKGLERKYPSLNIWCILFAVWIGLGISLDHQHYR